MTATTIKIKENMALDFPHQIIKEKDTHDKAHRAEKTEKATNDFLRHDIIEESAENGPGNDEAISKTIQKKPRQKQHRRRGTGRMRAKNVLQAAAQLRSESHTH